MENPRWERSAFSLLPQLSISLLNIACPAALSAPNQIHVTSEFTGYYAVIEFATWSCMTAASLANKFGSNPRCAIKTRMWISSRIVKKIDYSTYLREEISSVHISNLHWEIRENPFDNLLILTRTFKEKGFLRRVSIDGLKDRGKGQPLKRSCAEMKQRAITRMLFSVLRWQGEEEHSWSSTKAIFVMRSNSLHVTSSLCGHLRKWHTLRIPLSDISSSVIFGENPDFCQPPCHPITSR